MRHQARAGRYAASRNVARRAERFRHSEEQFKRKAQAQKARSLYIDELSNGIAKALVNEAPAVVAETTGTSERAVYAWIEQAHLPSLPVAIHLAHQHPEIRNLLLRLILVGPESAEGEKIVIDLVRFVEAHGHD